GCFCLNRSSRKTRRHGRAAPGVPRGSRGVACDEIPDKCGCLRPCKRESCLTNRSGLARASFILSILPYLPKIRDWLETARREREVEEPEKFVSICILPGTRFPSVVP